MVSTILPQKSDIFQQIKALPFAEVCQAFYDGKIKNGFTICPFHPDRTPSLKIYADGYHCFGCGAHGDAADFIAKLFDLKPLEAARAIAHRFGLDNSQGPGRFTEREKGRSAWRAYEELETRAFKNLCRYRDATNYLVQHAGDIGAVDDELAWHVHRLAIVENCLQVLATGTARERLELLRKGVIGAWAKL